MAPSKCLILGGGVSGLAAGHSSGFPVFEAQASPGGICSSYYVRPGSADRLPNAPEDGEAYHFEIGGGHWIFGGDPEVLNFIRALTPVKSYSRVSSVYFRKTNCYVPYPLQNNLRFLGSEVASKALEEMEHPSGGKILTMKDWLRESFGQTLCELFFYPFHDLYTAGYYENIAPQDDYKSPVNIKLANEGAKNETSSVGYNVNFIYPQDGLNVLAQNMAKRCDMRYEKRITGIDVHKRQVLFSDGGQEGYDKLISTLPLNKMMGLTGLSVEADPDPHVSVLVLNIGAMRGPLCPDDHWLYVPDAVSKFHRVGFYSNVDRIFLPSLERAKADRVSIYVERAYRTKPTEQEVKQYTDSVLNELRQWGYIDQVEVVDPTWIEVAYTWAYPGSTWKQLALEALKKHDIHQVGRYGRWTFQGITDSIRDGSALGKTRLF